MGGQKPGGGGADWARGPNVPVGADSMHWSATDPGQQVPQASGGVGAAGWGGPAGGPPPPPPQTVPQQHHDLTGWLRKFFWNFCLQITSVDILSLLIELEQ